MTFYPATPERVFAAFADPAKKRRWFAESDHHEVGHYEMDFRVGGAERAHFRFKEGAPLKGIACTNDASYQGIVPNRRVVFASTMTVGERRIQGAFFEGAGGPEMREAGWRKLLEQLTEALPR